MAQDTPTSPPETHLRIHPGGQLWAWGAAIIKMALIIWVLLSMGSVWSTKAISVGYQVIGSLLALLGVAVIADLLQAAADRLATTTKRIRAVVALWWGQRRERIQRWWARVRGRPRPIVVQIGVAEELDIADSVSVTLTRHRVDRDTISDRDWLIHLDDRVETIMVLLEQGEQRRATGLADIDQRLGLQHAALTAEIVEARRAGWQLVAGGLLCSLVGAFLSGWA